MLILKFTGGKKHAIAKKIPQNNGELTRPDIKN